MKNYPLEIETYQDPGAYWSKGHHDKREFAERVNKDYREDIDPRAVAHVWVRCRPALPHERDEYAWFHEAARKGTQGAFPITQVGI